MSKTFHSDPVCFAQDPITTSGIISPQCIEPINRYPFTTDFVRPDKRIELPVSFGRLSRMLNRRKNGT